MQEKIKEMARAIDELLVEKPKETTKHAMNVATYLFDRGYRKQEWISVEERLPETDGEYLTFNGLIYYLLNFNASLRLWNVSNDNVSTAIRDVTHWMPLPEPPKMKGGDGK